jgi:hypothetical protein
MLDPKWTGTAADRHEMHSLQLKQVVRVSAHLPPDRPLVLTAAPAQLQQAVHVRLRHDLALHLGSHRWVCPFTNARTAVANHSLSTFGLALVNGGTAGLFWNYIIAAIGLGFVYSSIAELASM